MGIRNAMADNIKAKDLFQKYYTLLFRAEHMFCIKHKIFSIALCGSH